MKSKRVLIVDDNDLNRKLFESLIGHLFSYESAKNGLEAVELATKSKFDLIIMDIQMPLMDGITAMKKIRQECPGICPILAVTAYAEDSDRGGFIAEGFDNFITKPIRPKDFLKLVQDYLIVKKNSGISEQADNEEFHILDRKSLDQLLRYNSQQSLQMIFTEFLSECTETEKQIDGYQLDNDPTELMNRIHTLKGNSGTLGAMRIFRCAKAAEERARNEKYTEFNQELKKLKNEILQFRNFLERELIFDL
jgi:two-component system alkaline phosphatase synthesis response regulator PhoP